MGVYNILLLVAVFATVPFWIHVLNGYNYYYDYVAGLFQHEPPDTFDFIVGKSSLSAYIVLYVITLIINSSTDTRGFSL